MVDLTLAQLASRLRVTHRRASDLVASGAVTGRQLSSGAWLVDSDSVARYELRRRGAGRKLDSGTAWAVLWELSGLRAGWLSESTRARVRRRIRTSEAVDLVTEVAVRTRAHRFRSANSDRVAEDVIATGRLAAAELGTALIVDDRRIAGYVPAGTDIDEFATAHFMARDEAGHDVLFENTLPVPYSGRAMPAAVIAADLAISTDTRERSAGVSALAELRGTWLAAAGL